MTDNSNIDLELIGSIEQMLQGALDKIEEGDGDLEVFLDSLKETATRLNDMHKEIHEISIKNSQLRAQETFELISRRLPPGTLFDSRLLFNHPGPEGAHLYRTTSITLNKNCVFIHFVEVETASTNSGSIWVARRANDRWIDEVSDLIDIFTDPRRIRDLLDKTANAVQTRRKQLSSKLQRLLDDADELDSRLEMIAAESRELDSKEEE